MSHYEALENTRIDFDCPVCGREAVARVDEGDRHRDAAPHALFRGNCDPCGAEFVFVVGKPLAGEDWRGEDA